MGVNFAGEGTRIEGLSDFIRDLQAVGRGWPASLGRIHRSLADIESDRVRSAARRRGGVWAKSAAAIQGGATQKQARIDVRPTKSTVMAPAAFWGTKRRTGWYNRGRAHSSTGQRQHPEWVGNTWDVARRGQGPHVSNDQLAADLPDIQRRYEQMVDDLYKRAFPERA